MADPTACVIGAGSSGIAATKALAQAGIDVVCYERSDRIGGLWAFREGAEKTAAYRSLHINTSRKRMEYSDFPMPESYPDFPSHRQVAEYFEAYVDKFGLRQRIRFGTSVDKAELTSEGKWRITSGGEARIYDALLVANGHHWDPRWPEPPFPGRFDGTVMHSHQFVDAQAFAGKRVLILGMGNSAMDIAVESSYHAEAVFLAARRGAHIVPKYALGKPIDTLSPGAWMPFAWRMALMRMTIGFVQGPVERYGLPKPDHRLGEAHPTVSSDILSRVSHGAVLPKANIQELAGDSVRFADGSVEKIDAIVYCTGYKVTFPFFDESFIAAPDNDLPLFRRVFKPGVPHLGFIGLCQPLGALMPIAEAQGRWFAEYLRGRYVLPDEAEMRRDIEKERAAMFARYVKSKRHTMEIDYDGYLRELAREMKRGARRAPATAAAVSVPAGEVREAGATRR